MKIRVYDSDGVYIGGLFKTDCFNAMTCRVWHGPPNPHYSEHLIDISGFGDPSREGSWYVLQIAREDDQDTTEHNTDEIFAKYSRAIRVTPVEALSWFELTVYQAPDDLLELVKAYDPDTYDRYTISEDPVPLTDDQKEVWDALDGKALTAKELSMEATGRRDLEDAMRKRVAAIRNTGRVIDNKQGAGYFRPDAPPESD
jgi:hypothetical protein